MPISCSHIPDIDIMYRQFGSFFKVILQDPALWGAAAPQMVVARHERLSHVGGLLLLARGPGWFCQGCRKNRLARFKASFS